MADGSLGSFAQRDEKRVADQRWHFALNAGALLTEPWTALLIHVFSKSAVLLLKESDEAADEVADEAAQESSSSSNKSSLGEISSSTSSIDGTDQDSYTGQAKAEILARRADDCIRALKYLGRKSDTARLVADTLDDALRARIKRLSMNDSVTGVNGLNENEWDEANSLTAGLGSHDAWLGILDGGGVAVLDQDLPPELGCFVGPQGVVGLSGGIWESL